MEKESKKLDFQIDWGMFFSVIKPEELIANANKFYRQKLMLVGEGGEMEKPQSKGSEGNEAANGAEVSKPLHLYKFTMNRLSSDEQKLQNKISPFSTIIEKVGIFNNLHTIMKAAGQDAIFCSLDETDIFLRAYLQAHTATDLKSAFFCTEKAIMGLDNQSYH